jgi:hypothetical protein
VDFNICSAKKKTLVALGGEFETDASFRTYKKRAIPVIGIAPFLSLPDFNSNIQTVLFRHLTPFGASVFQLP